MSGRVLRSDTPRFGQALGAIGVQYPYDSGVCRQVGQKIPRIEKGDLTPDRPGTRASRVAGVIGAVWRGAGSDWGQVSMTTLGARTARRLLALGLGPDLSSLLRQPIFRAHLSALAVEDPLFFLAQRYYLTRDLGVSDRARAATTHYLTEQLTQPASYLSAVYLREGLPLWAAEVGGHHYEIRLTGALNVANEGALSVSLMADQMRVGIMSFSFVPLTLVAPEAADPGAAVFLVRKQLTRDRSYQKPFFDAFDRSTPAHLLLATVEGLAQARGVDRIHGVRAACHPAITKENRSAMTAAYDDFWESVGGTVVSARAYCIPVPMQLRSVEDLQPDRRHRALARRGHAAAIRASACQVMLAQR